jgi:dihydroorotate dehydrogenase electron transfer subunit
VGGGFSQIAADLKIFAKSTPYRVEGLNMANIIQRRAQVVSNTPAGPGYFRIRVSCDPHYAEATPGQFVMVRLTGQIDPLLPRPFSIHRVIKKDGAASGIELLYKVVGKGTRALSLRQPGDDLDLTGPLGKGFTIPGKVGPIKIVAGGIGVAPMIFLVEYLQEQIRDRPDVQVFLGGRSKADLLCLPEFSTLGVPVYTTTDDGSSGDHCLVTDPLDDAMAENKPDIIYACGPLEMLACVAGIADKHRVPCQVSIETMMACGMGACLGCAVVRRNHTDTYLHACLDGPVFDIKAIEI